MGHNVSRREFLRYCCAASSATLFSDPIRALMGALVDGLIAKSQAQALDRPVMDYLALVMEGGPPRWVFDLPLRATDADLNTNLLAADMLRTTQSQGYRTVRVGNYNLPLLWNMSLPYSGGQSASMAPLAQHALMIRGVETINNHPGGRILSTRPDAASVSLNGLVADHSHRNVPAVNLQAQETFKSHSGLGELRLEHLRTEGGVSPLERLLDPFIEQRSGIAFFERRQAATMDRLVESAMKSLQAHHEAGTPGLDTLYANASKAEAQLRAGLGSLRDTYAARLAKYQGIVNSAYVAGDWNSSLGFTLGGISSSIPGLAEVFALTEHLFVEKLSSSIHSQIFSIPGVDNDAHNLSADLHLRGFSYYFRAVAACIYELSRNVEWNNTAVHLCSEFSRNPRNGWGGEGSDHGFQGNAASIFSGAIRGGPYVVGNITMDTDDGYRGLWGKGARVDLDGGKVMNMGNLGSAIATVLGVQTPTPNFNTPIGLSGSTITSYIGEPKVI
jgi:hypothetical protein